MERIEIYPYQRIKETPGSRLFRKKQALISVVAQLNPGQWFPYRVNMSEVWKVLITGNTLLLGLLAMIMARAVVLGELLPFMFAGLAAFGRRNPIVSAVMVAFSIAGLLSSGQTLNLYPNVTAMLVLAGILYSIKMEEDKYWWGIPVISIAVVFLVKSIFLLVTGVSFYNEMVIVFESLITGILTFVFMVASDAVHLKKTLDSFTFEDVAAFLIIGVGIVMGVDGVTVAGLSLSGILCRLGVLVAAFLWGAGRATMVGVMAGIIPSIASSIFSFSLALYAVSGLLAGIFRSMGRLGIIIGFMLGTMAFSMFIPETQANVLGIWETGIACLVFCLLPESFKSNIGNMPGVMPGEIIGRKARADDTHLQEAAVDKVRNFSRVFEEMACALDNPKKPMTYQQQNDYMNYLYGEISSGFCRKCMYYERCWVKNCYGTSREMLNLFAIAETAGMVTSEDCSQEFKRMCVYNRDIIGVVNNLYNSLRLNEYWAGRLDESCTMISQQLKGLSRAIENLADHFDYDGEVDYGLQDKLFSELRKEGIRAIDCTPVRMNSNHLHVKMKMKSCANGTNCQQNVAPLVSAILGDKVEVGEKQCPSFMGKGSCEFVLNRTPSYKISTGIAQLGKEAVCGDSFTMATLPEGTELIALSDGMGVGEEASTQSQSAVRMLETLLEAGFDQEAALKTINSTLILRSARDNFATLDIAMIDIYTAEIHLLKTGGVPSFIKRGRSVEVVRASSLPVGIVETVDIFHTTRRISPRDMLVMVSDGVLDLTRSDFEDDRQHWIQELLKTVESGDPQVLAEMILNRALSLCQGKPNDDMTVICIYFDLNLPN